MCWFECLLLVLCIFSANHGYLMVLVSAAIRLSLDKRRFGSSPSLLQADFPTTPLQLRLKQTSEKLDVRLFKGIEDVILTNEIYFHFVVSGVFHRRQSHIPME